MENACFAADEQFFEPVLTVLSVDFRLQPVHVPDPGYIERWDHDLGVVFEDQWKPELFVSSYCLLKEGPGVEVKAAVVVDVLEEFSVF